MAKTIKDLFKSKQSTFKDHEIYGIIGTALIDSRGLLNIPRQAALLASSPNALADLIGNQIGGALGGNANRPTDTIFKSNKTFAKPVSIVPTQAALRDAIEPNTSYFVKKSPAPASIFAKIKQGGSSPLGVAQSLAVGAINKFGSKNGKNAFKSYVNNLKKAGTIDDEYGTKYQTNEQNKVKSEDRIYSKYYYTTAGTLDTRENTAILNGISQWDYNNFKILESLAGKEKQDVTDKDVKDFKKTNELINTPYVLIKLYGKTDKNILLPGTISGISEDFAPEVSSFKYIGSPFNLYRYGGVERTLKFDLKTYFVDKEGKISMKKNLDKLRRLVFPDEDISVIKYPGDNGYSPLLFNPNLVYVTINGLYENLFCIIDSLSISIDDNTPWATTWTPSENPADSGDGFNPLDGVREKPYPTVFNVSMGMKIIEHPAIKDNKYLYGASNEKGNGYTNYFTGEHAIGNYYAQKEGLTEGFQV